MNRIVLRSLAALVMIAGLSLFGQASKGPWWSRETIKELNLNPDQVGRMRATLKEYRPRLTDLRAAVQKAEQDLETVFNSDPVDQQKSNEAIEHVVTARADLSRTLAQLGLQLRTVLTLQQWQQVEQRYAAKTAAKPQPSSP